MHKRKIIKQDSGRRQFIKITAATGIGIGLNSIVPFPSLANSSQPLPGKRVGIIGLDTSHSIAFTKALNKEDATTAFRGYKIIAAYPYGSKDIKSSAERIPEYIQQVKQLGVKIVDSIAELLKMTDVILLETNDGRLHLEQVLPVFQAGKRVFIDKPITASLKDAIKIFEASKKYQVPVFSSSSLRYTRGLQEIIQTGKLGPILAADAYSPLHFEKTHPDLFWYGIHGVEMLFTLMGTGCESVVRTHSDQADVVVGTWKDKRIGLFRGLPKGKQDYGGTAYGEKGISTIGTYDGNGPLLEKIIEFFDTGIPPVSAGETLEILAFMEAADESKRKGGIPVLIEDIYKKAGAKNKY
jgi:predicted dehydrogenase